MVRGHVSLLTDRHERLALLSEGLPQWTQGFESTLYVVTYSRRFE